MAPDNQRRGLLEELRERDTKRLIIIFAVIGLIAVMSGWPRTKPYCEDMDIIADRTERIEKALSALDAEVSNDKEDAVRALQDLDEEVGELKDFVEKCQCPDADEVPDRDPW